MLMHIRAGSYSFKLTNDSIGTLSFKKEQRLQYIKDKHGYPMQFKPHSQPKLDPNVQT